MKFSELSRKYSSSVEREDFAAAAELVGQAAKEAGFLVGPAYHGTDTKFTVFEHSEDIGFHFGTAAAADGRIRQAGIDADSVVVKAFLKIANPLRVDDMFTWAPEEVREALLVKQIITPEEYGNMDIVGREEVCGFLQRSGYDAIIYKNETEGGGDSFIVFESRQIRDASAVVLDDAGMPMTLERRFLSDSSDIRGDAISSLERGGAGGRAEQRAPDCSIGTSFFASGCRKCFTRRELCVF